jgi:hypothetical protein
MELLSVDKYVLKLQYKIIKVSLCPCQTVCPWPNLPPQELYSAMRPVSTSRCPSIGGTRWGRTLRSPCHPHWSEPEPEKLLYTQEHRGLRTEMASRILQWLLRPLRFRKSKTRKREQSLLLNCHKNSRKIFMKFSAETEVDTIFCSWVKVDQTNITLSVSTYLLHPRRSAFKT